MVGPDTANGRVTLAVVQNDVKHLTAEVQAWRAETRDTLREIQDQVESNTRAITILDESCLRINAIKMSAIIGGVVVVVGVLVKAFGLF